MSDISDLIGVFPTPFRWNAEYGTASISIWDEATGERVPKEAELGSPAAKFAADLATRSRGYGRVKVGLYDMRLTAVGRPPPPWPDDAEFKPAVGMWLWNPPFGELRLETSASLLVRAISNLWDRCRSFSEPSRGLQPIIHFIDRREKPIAALGKTFFEPIINIVGWVDRDKVPAFRLREQTVAPPPALPASSSLGGLQDRVRDKPTKPIQSSAVPVGPLNDELDDALPW